MQHIHSHTSPTHKHTQRTRTKHLLLLLLQLSCVMYIVFCPPLLLSLLTLILLLFSRLLCCVHVSRFSSSSGVLLLLAHSHICMSISSRFYHLCPLCHCPLSIVHCAVSFVTHTLSKLSYRRYHQRLLLLRSLLLSLLSTLSLSVALSGSPRLQLAKGHRVRFVISASNKTHPFANTRCTLDNRHPRYPLDMGQGHAVQQ